MDSLKEPADHIVEFILYVMPGFLAFQLFRAKYPAKQLSDFLQVAWSLIYGVVLAALVHGVDDRFLRGWLQSGAPGFPALRFVLALVMAGVVGGLVLIFLNLGRFKIARRFPRFSSVAPGPQSIWVEVNRPSNEFAVVYLDDGAIYSGWIRDYTFDPDSENNDFLLGDAHRVDDELNTLYLVNGRGVYLNTRNVKRIEFVR